ncbi:hypothetical protein [Cohnella panacarvi]|uniref:hypothetical protein n=1 Tax=Cohnella panacarvi TaxID=400776 RepID=UPI0004B355C5|nr:hypothetical protein [Cohnella panacarvi]
MINMNVKGEVVFRASCLYIEDFAGEFAVIGDRMANGTIRYGMIDTILGFQR